MIAQSETEWSVINFITLASVFHIHSTSSAVTQNVHVKYKHVINKVITFPQKIAFGEET